MDVDAYVSEHEAQWHRLERLLGTRRLSAAEADELVDLYQRVSTHLSVVRTENPDPSLVRYLSALLTRARIASASSRPVSWASVGEFVTRTFPAALYRSRRWWLAVWAVNLLVAIGLIAWTMRHPELYGQVLTKDDIDRLVNHDIENYYSEYAHHEFATLVWVNNAWVSAQCIAMGVLGLPVLYVLWQNIFNVGILGGLMFTYGKGGLFLGLILPHGLLELTAVFVAAATGLRLFWSWIVPGTQTRLQSFAAEGRIAMVMVLGLAGVLLVSGLIEGFVTPSPLPTAVRVGIGVAAEVAFFAYVYTLGRRAFREGVTGDLSRRDVGDVAPVAS